MLKLKSVFLLISLFTILAIIVLYFLGVNGYFDIENSKSAGLLMVQMNV